MSHFEKIENMTFSCAKIFLKCRVMLWLLPIDCLRCKKHKTKLWHGLKTYRSQRRKVLRWFFQKAFLKTFKICIKYTHFKKGFVKKSLKYFSELYIAIYGVSAHVISMFHVSYSQAIDWWQSKYHTTFQKYFSAG